MTLRGVAQMSGPGHALCSRLRDTPCVQGFGARLVLEASVHALCSRLRDTPCVQGFGDAPCVEGLEDVYKMKRCP